MLTPFDQIESRAFGRIRDRFGSSWTYLPMKKRPNKRAVVDNSRSQFDFCAILYTDSQKLDLDKNERIDRVGRGKGMSYQSVSSKSLRLNVQLCDLQVEPRQFDVVRRNEDDRVYEITDISPEGHSDVYFDLVEIEGPYSHVIP